tara:strand:- start:4099 stop:4845 length:747 start_codon:yes stop_codon:yes gene_type:complete
MLNQLGIEEGPFIREEGGFMAQTLAKITPPFTSFPSLSGGGYNSQLRNKQAGENAIIKDMHNVFTVRERGYLEFLIRRAGRNKEIMLTLNNASGPYEIVADAVNPSSVASAMNYIEYWENYRGRTAIFNGDTIARWTSNRQMWITQEIWDAVYHQKSSKVGYAKGSLARYAVALGRPQPPMWIRRNYTPAMVPVTGSHVMFSANAAGLDVAARNFGRVEQNRIMSIRSKLNRKVRDKARLVGWQTNIL